jgi:small subunit ribosomal protein S21
MIIVEVNEKNSIEKALKRYKNKFQNIGIIKELRDRKNFKKKSDLKREQIKKAKYIEQKRKEEE